MRSSLARENFVREDQKEKQDARPCHYTQTKAARARCSRRSELQLGVDQGHNRATPIPRRLWTPHTSVFVVRVPAPAKIQQPCFFQPIPNAKKNSSPLHNIERVLAIHSSLCNGFEVEMAKTVKNRKSVPVLPHHNRGI